MPSGFVAGKTLLIVLLGLVVYLPALHGDFVLDDTLYVTNNTLNTQADGLRRIWFTLESRDYWPVSYSALWLEWHVCGMNPTGYHITNLVLHTVSALLVWLLLSELSIPGAFLAALLFTVHPVNVESVAWISQLKGLLALNFFLLSLLAYLRNGQFRAGEDQLAIVDPDQSQIKALRSGGRKIVQPLTTRWYWLSLGAFLLAMLSKGSVAILPLVSIGNCVVAHAASGALPRFFACCAVCAHRRGVDGTQYLLSTPRRKRNHSHSQRF